MRVLFIVCISSRWICLGGRLPVYLSIAWKINIWMEDKLLSAASALGLDGGVLACSIESQYNADGLL